MPETEDGEGVFAQGLSEGRWGVVQAFGEDQSGPREQPCKGPVGSWL